LFIPASSLVHLVCVSQVLQEAGEFQEALLKLQAVMAAAPATPGLLQRLQAASAQALCHRGGATAPFKVKRAVTDEMVLTPIALRNHSASFSSGRHEQNIGTTNLLQMCNSDQAKCIDQD